jgi:hypothetical protein
MPHHECGNAILVQDLLLIGGFGGWHWNEPVPLKYCVASLSLREIAT